MSLDKIIKSNKNILFILGFAVLILGIVLVLIWWQDVAALFRGGIGMVIALAGMLLLYMVKE